MTGVLVIGAGVMGLTTAVCLAEAGVQVQVVSDVRPCATTSAAAGAVWDPYQVGPAALVEQWSSITLAALTELSAKPDCGVRLVHGTQESRVLCEIPSWANLVGARRCRPEELRSGFVTGWRYRAPIVDMPCYLSYLTRRLRDANGGIRIHHYASLHEAVREPVEMVVNCSGANARWFASDPLVEAVRGELVVTDNPGIREFFCDDTPGSDCLTYIYPHAEKVVLGGTWERGRWDTVPDEQEGESIVRRCAVFEPALAKARVLERRVGLRPKRPQIRFDEEILEGTRVLHCYGHGGGGLTLSWGCAREAAQRVCIALGR